jgi:hypothetical protein
MDSSGKLFEAGAFNLAGQLIEFFLTHDMKTNLNGQIPLAA